MSTFNLTHSFLLAMPQLDDSCFEKSLIYILDHDEHEVAGLIINTPSESSFIELLEEISPPTSPNNSKNDSVMHKCSEEVLSSPLLFGGPVDLDQPFVLYESTHCWPDANHISGNIYLTTNLSILQDIANNEGPEKYLVILGYAGWSSDQLAGELINNDWLTLPATSDILFDTPYEHKQQKAAQQLGINITQLSSQVGHA
jgi:putative transcriptional regulator